MPRKNVHSLSSAVVAVVAIVVIAVPLAVIYTRESDSSAASQDVRVVATNSSYAPMPTASNTNETLTEHPATAPTVAPSDESTATPTLSVDNNVTAFPTSSPTATSAPTYGRVPTDMVFRLRMHWEVDYFWQEEADETFWCMECADCGGEEGLNFNDDGSGCDLRGWDCEAYDQIWILRCDDNFGHIFKVNHVDQYDQIQLENAELCLERTKRRYLTVQPCDATNIDQLFLGLNTDRFELRPANGELVNDLEPWCATQKHHPKSYEIVGFQTCEDAQIYDTSFWELYEVQT